MTEFGYHAPHDQFPPEELLELAVLAEDCGFDAIHSTNHYGAYGGEAGFAWSWLGATMCRTAVPFEVVTTPGWRFHPAQVAHSISTTARLYPRRLIPALGTADEGPETSWPAPADRHGRMAEAATVIRSLLTGVTEDGEPAPPHLTKGWTLPEVVPPLFASVRSAKSAYEVAVWADGLIASGAQPSEAAEVVEAFRSRAGTKKPVHLLVDVAWRRNLEQAREEAAMHWRAHVATADLPESRMERQMIITDDAGELAERLHTLASFGVERILLNPVGPDQAGFLRGFCDKVRPDL